ncbi:MerR-like DNA binding protein [Stackebrandtia endophytica]|uniref:MerR-like DNA binding protein n=1 Tax=Stackebrandtia endophytica TaxID=1496996 RepID=A0A543AX96_9ACTN|nr:MerR family DNA-binding protein [Stackebrandtia endophytica]TQL77183.1 MerR-like DNA binding protein [Stackebrandtia endophytica]
MRRSQCAKIAGLSLEQIRLLLDGDVEQRRSLALAHAAHLDRRAAEITAARQMIGHVIDCRRDDCIDCATPHDTFGFPRA